MTAAQIFKSYPKAEKCFQAGNSEFFLEESEADAYCEHFNVKKKVILRSEVVIEPAPGTKKDNPKKGTAKKEAAATSEVEEESEEGDDSDSEGGNDQENNPQ